MMSNIPVLLPATQMPPYSYVPGKFPHPIRDPKGHSFGTAAEKVMYLDPDKWDYCDTYLRGIDLFNHGYYWESHESWEAVWNAAGREGTVADFIKGLIKLAAASVKAREGSAIGVARHATRGDKLFGKVQAETPNLMGLSLVELREFAQHLASNAEQVVNTSDAPVARLHDYVLVPAKTNATKTV
ncbi:MAG: DUF309 domain-containing protein [Planctomycetales bacterium]|nr:DUF309 domain-containing protein [Planctomycetales bacterium]